MDLLNAEIFFFRGKIFIVRMCFGKHSTWKWSNEIFIISTLLKDISYLELYCYKETYQSLISTRVHARFLLKSGPWTCSASLPHENKSSRMSWLSNALGDGEVSRYCGLYGRNILSLAGWVNSNIQDAFIKPIKGEEYNRYLFFFQYWSCKAV